MEFLLVPGKIYLKVPRAVTPIGPPPSKCWRGDSGLAFMASCRRAQQEGHKCYYGQNTFYLPPGKIGHTLKFFETLRPEYATLMTSIGIEISITDETLDMFDTVVSRAKQRAGSLLELESSPPSWTDLATAIAGQVQCIWLEKLDWIRSRAGYEKVNIHFGNHNTLSLRGQDLDSQLQDIAHWSGLSDADDCNEWVTEFLRNATSLLIGELRAAFDTGGMDYARNWIIRGCPVDL